MEGLYRVPLSGRWQQNILTKYTVSVEVLIFANCCSIPLKDRTKRDVKTESMNRCARLAIKQELSRELKVFLCVILKTYTR